MRFDFASSQRSAGSPFAGLLAGDGAEKWVHFANVLPASCTTVSPQYYPGFEKWCSRQRSLRHCAARGFVVAPLQCDPDHDHPERIRYR